MKILLLGGTVFLGRHLVETALRYGHELTLFNRGLHGPDLYPEVEQLRGDRRGDLSALKGRQWDAVLDTNGYVPSLVRRSARLLAAEVKQYVFISTVSVYADMSMVGVDETAPVSSITQAQLSTAEQLIPPDTGTPDEPTMKCTAHSRPSMSRK